jgi:hypothetical protein
MGRGASILLKCPMLWMLADMKYPFSRYIISMDLADFALTVNEDDDNNKPDV